MVDPEARRGCQINLAEVRLPWVAGTGRGPKKMGCCPDSRKKSPPKRTPPRLGGSLPSLDDGVPLMGGLLPISSQLGRATGTLHSRCGLESTLALFPAPPAPPYGGASGISGRRGEGSDPHPAYRRSEAPAPGWARARPGRARPLGPAALKGRPPRKGPRRSTRCSTGAFPTGAPVAPYGGDRRS